VVNVLTLVNVEEASLASSQLVGPRGMGGRGRYMVSTAVLHMDTLLERWGLHSDVSRHLRLLKLMQYDAVYFDGGALALVSDADDSRISLNVARWVMQAKTEDCSPVLWRQYCYSLDRHCCGETGT